MVPLADGRFDLDDYIDHVIAMLHALGPATPRRRRLSALRAGSRRRGADGGRRRSVRPGQHDPDGRADRYPDIARPPSTGSPPRRASTGFRRNVILQVPFPHPGALRAVYPGFLQLSGFMSMNHDRHLDAHKAFYDHLVEGDGDSAAKHRAFYDDYLAVMDLTAEFYLQTVDQVFISHSLPEGRMRHRGRLVDPGSIRRVALLTVEGELDDITGMGQTQAAHRLCANIPAEMQGRLRPARRRPLRASSNGSRFREAIAPRMAAFMRAHPGPAGEGRRARPS